MHIQYYGLSCVKVTTKPGGRGAQDVAIVVNPFNRVNGLTPPQLAKANIVVTTKDAPTYCSESINGTDTVAITMPGEYAVYGTHIVGTAIASSDGNVAPATLYVIESEGLKVAILAGTNMTPSAQQFEEINGAHIMIIAVGADSFDTDRATEIIRKVEPSYVLPLAMAPGAVDALCNQVGTCPKESVQKVVLKEKDCDDTGTKVVLMAP